MAHSDTSITESQLPSAEPVAWLVYKFAANGGVVFDTVEQAIYDETVHGALAEAKTWDELRRFLPEGEWETIEELLLEAVDYDLEDQKHLWELDETPFDENQIPGYCDGNYPHLGPHQFMDAVIQEVLLEVLGVNVVYNPLLARRRRAGRGGRAFTPCAGLPRGAYAVPARVVIASYMLLSLSLGSYW